MHNIGSSLSPHSFHVIPSSWFMRNVCFSDCFDISIHFFSFLTVSLITLFFLLPVNFIFQDVVADPPVQLP